MKIIDTLLKDVLLLELPVFRDARGFFCESFNEKQWQEITGLTHAFVQDNHSHSTKGVLRGLHYQLAPHAQGKLIRILNGQVFTVAVDLRRQSEHCGKSVTMTLQPHQQLWLPPGFAHGFLVLSDTADCLYKTTAYYAPTAERSICWNDPQLAIQWPLAAAPIVSERDLTARAFADADLFDE